MLKSYAVVSSVSAGGMNPCADPALHSLSFRPSRVLCNYANRVNTCTFQLWYKKKDLNRDQTGLKEKKKKILIWRFCFMVRFESQSQLLGNLHSFAR